MQPDSSELIKTNNVRFHAIMDATPECIKIAAPDGRLMFMNQAGLLMVEAPRVSKVIHGKSLYIASYWPNRPVLAIISKR